MIRQYTITPDFNPKFLIGKEGVLLFKIVDNNTVLEIVGDGKLLDTDPSLLNLQVHEDKSYDNN